jgi:23S rRNA (uridine2552-2'-O)-methyltransferase
LSGPWRKQQSRDPYFRKSKAEGYRARSAYKLIEINDKYHLIQPGATVLDLGASPGSWSQVAAGLVGPKGRVVAVDIQPMDPLPGVEVIQGDITRPDVIADLELALPDGADAVISDVSPQISGIAPTDHARSVELALASLDIARRCLRSGGAFVVKVFHGEDFDRFVAEARPHFQKIHIFRPQASRKESREHYVVGLGFLPP